MILHVLSFGPLKDCYGQHLAIWEKAFRKLTSPLSGMGAWPSEDASKRAGLDLAFNGKK
jgi:hypothetical protein